MYVFDCSKTQSYLEHLNNFNERYNNFDERYNKIIYIKNIMNNLFQVYKSNQIHTLKIIRE